MDEDHTPFSIELNDNEVHTFEDTKYEPPKPTSNNNDEIPFETAESPTATSEQTEPQPEIQEHPIDGQAPNPENADDLFKDVVNDLGEFDPRLELSNYTFPDVSLLENHQIGNSEVSKEELISNKNRIVETLGNYKIKIDKIKATIGPTITLYEIVPAPGVRISKIKNLEDDIALSLSALGIRIIAPIPGKGTIGIEVPNQKPEIVAMRFHPILVGVSRSKIRIACGLGQDYPKRHLYFRPHQDAPPVGCRGNRSG